MAKKSSAKKTASKKPATQKSAIKQAAAPKPVAKKTPAKKIASKKPAAKKAAAKKTPAKKSPVAKATAKKASAKKIATGTAAGKTRAAKKAAPKADGSTAKVKTPYPAAFLKKQRQALLDEKDKLLESMQGVQRDQLRQHDSGAEASGLGDHLADAGNDSTEHDFALSILTKEQGDLRDIDDALARIDRGVYGICEGSGEVIPKVRLEYIPAARYTRDFQEEMERTGGLGNRRLGRSARIAGAEDVAIESMEESVDI